jgi:hypothetical protein
MVSGHRLGETLFFCLASNLPPDGYLGEVVSYDPFLGDYVIVRAND